MVFMFLYLSYSDIAEMTRRVNRLENELNQLGEENEALRDQLGLGVGERVDLSPLRRRKQTELEQLRKDYKLIENEVRKACVYVFCF